MTDATVALVRTIREGLPGTHEWDEREALILTMAEAQAADIDRLAADVAENGVRLSNGRLNTALCELRQGRVALGRLIGLVEIPESARPATVHARKAARARWAS